MVDTVVGCLVDGLTVCASMFCHQDTCGSPIHAFAANINNMLLSYWLFTTEFLMNLSLYGRGRQMPLHISSDKLDCEFYLVINKKGPPTGDPCFELQPLISKSDYVHSCLILLLPS